MVVYKIYSNFAHCKLTIIYFINYLNVIKMADTTVYKIPDVMSGSGNSLDPNLLFSMMNNNGGFGSNGNWIWVIFLFFLYGWNRNGNGLFGNTDGSNGTSYLASQAERDMLMQAINGNASAIQSLAGYLNTDINAVQTAINGVQSSVQAVGNQVGLTGSQVINSIQQGNMTLASQLSQCCCDNKLLQCQYHGDTMSRIDTLATNLAQGLSAQSYETANQTCSIQNSIKDQTQSIMDKLGSMEANAQQDKINTLTAELATANARAERNAELQPIIQQLNNIKAAQPATATVQYPNLVGVPLSQALYGYGYGSNSFWS